MKLTLKDIPVYYINLDDQDEKRKQTESLLKRLGFTYVERFSAIKHEKGRMVGCARSHYEILNKNIKPPFIILEDDCILNGNFINEIQIPDNSDALYLGISHWGRYLNHSGPYVHCEKVSDILVKVYNMLTTHAILYISDEYRNICKKVAYYYGYLIEDHLDIGFAEIQKIFNVYALDDPLFIQYEWSVTSKKLSENSFDKASSEQLYNGVLTNDQNFYKINSVFRSPLKPLFDIKDLNGIPGYFLPTRLI